MERHLVRNRGITLNDSMGGGELVIRAQLYIELSTSQT